VCASSGCTLYLSNMRSRTVPLVYPSIRNFVDGPCFLFNHWALPFWFRHFCPQGRDLDLDVILITRLLRESLTLTSLLISFTRSISHLSLAVLVSDCQFWRLLSLKVQIMVATKTLASLTTGLLIMLPFRHALLTACGNRHFTFKRFWKVSLPL